MKMSMPYSWNKQERLALSSWRDILQPVNKIFCVWAFERINSYFKIHLIDEMFHSQSTIFTTEGVRASIYNGTQLEGVKKLRDFMLEFQEKH